ncbi:MAG: response regulator [Chloroflexota bacterium]|nr:response regulator [Chloroflexota bacterium]
MVTKHILAGDDSPEILALLRDILEGEGYRVTMTPEALSLAGIKRARPDLVILNHMLEEGPGSGWELLRDLRQDADLGELPVVVCTGAVQRVRDNAGELERLGAQVVLKPFAIDDLLAAIRHFWPAAERAQGRIGD